MMYNSGYDNQFRQAFVKIDGVTGPVKNALDPRVDGSFNASVSFSVPENAKVNSPDANNAYAGYASPFSISLQADKNLVAELRHSKTQSDFTLSSVDLFPYTIAQNGATVLSTNHYHLTKAIVNVASIGDLMADEKGEETSAVTFYVRASLENAQVTGNDNTVEYINMGAGMVTPVSA